MRRFSLLIAALAISLALLPACGRNRDTREDPEPTPTVIEASDAVRLSDLLSSDEFDAVAAWVSDGSNLPSELQFYVSNGYDGQIADQDVILSTWKSLCDVRVDASSPITDVEVDDGDVSFTFVWPDGKTVGFLFETCSYFAMPDGTLYHVDDPSVVLGISEAASSYLDAQYAATADTVTEMGELSGTTFDWDTDGDGTFEHFSVTFHDNGDEAPSVIEITGDVAGQEQTVWIDRAYGISNLNAGTDERGAFLVVSYLEGDYYSHDAEATCTLRIVDGTLTVE